MIKEDNIEEQIIEEEQASKGKKLLIIILALFMISLMVLFSIPAYKIRVDPEPKNIPTIEELETKGIKFQSENNSLESQDKLNFIKLLNLEDPLIKQVANVIVRESCQETRQAEICHAKAIFYFVQKNINYISDPLNREYLASPRQTLFTKNGDCDDYSILLANLLQAIGLETRFVFIPGHVFVQVNLPEALAGYKDKEDWVSLDATCSTCTFGELPFKAQTSDRNYL